MHSSMQLLYLLLLFGAAVAVLIAKDPITSIRRYHFVVARVFQISQEAHKTSLFEINQVSNQPHILQ